VNHIGKNEKRRKCSCLQRAGSNKRKKKKPSHGFHVSSGVPLGELVVFPESDGGKPEHWGRKRVQRIVYSQGGERHSKERAIAGGAWLRGLVIHTCTEEKRGGCNHLEKKGRGMGKDSQLLIQKRERIRIGLTAESSRSVERWPHGGVCRP